VEGRADRLHAYAGCGARTQATRCNTVAPGQTRTEGLEHGLNQRRKGARLARIPINRFGEPEDVGNVIAFMLSPKARHVIGQVLSVDGGASIFGVF
jgi:3-oxoacyl-[acyl-carrier protein] reductase